MTELIIECPTQARDDLEAFRKEHPDHAKIERDDGAYGAELFSLVVEQLPDILSSLALLIAALKAKNIDLRAFKDGTQISTDELERTLQEEQ